MTKRAEGLRSTEQDAGWRTLMRKAQDGDREAYARLLESLLPLLRRVIGRRCRSVEDAEDIVQDVLLSVHAVRHTYDPGRPFLPWLMAIARRRLIDAARRSSRRAAHETTVETMFETFLGMSTNTEEQSHIDMELIEQALASLTPGQRRAVELLKLEGLSLREAAAVSGKSVATLKVTVHRALKVLRAVLGRELQVGWKR